MAKKMMKTNWRVVIEPDDRFAWRHWDESDYRQACEKVLAQVKRHVDNSEDASVKFDTEELCEFCKSEWETEESGEPLCCGKAVDEWKAAQAQASTGGGNG